MDGMNGIIKKIKQLISGFGDSQGKAAQKTMLEELFNDWYMQRGKVYKMNFIRGIFFGLGTALGGTLLLALIVWLLSLFVDFPLVGDFLRSTQDTINTPGE